MNVRLSATVFVISVLTLYYLLREISVFYIIIGYLGFAFQCWRERNFDWQSFFAFGTAWSAAGIAALLTIGILGFVLKLVGPFPTAIVLIVCSLAFLVLGVTYNFVRLRLQSETEVHGIKIGLVLFVLTVLISIPSYIWFAKMQSGQAYLDQTVHDATENYWSFMNQIDPESSEYMKNLIVRHQRIYEQLRNMQAQSMEISLGQLLTDEWPAVQFERSFAWIRLASEIGYLKMLTGKAYLSANAWKLMPESQRTEWSAGLQQYISAYLQTPAPEEVKTGSLSAFDVEEMDWGYGAVTNWVIRQPVRASKVYAYLLKAFTEGKRIKYVYFTNARNEYEIVRNLPEPSRSIGFLAMANLLSPEAQRSCQNFKQCTGYLTLEKYRLWRCYPRDTQLSLEQCYAVNAQKSWVCDLYDNGQRDACLHIHQ